MKNWFSKQWKENRSFIVFLLLMFVFRSAVADWNEVPTGSMKPTILEGDRILVNKMAYDIRVRFTHISIVELSNPERGDIVVFDSQVSGKKLVKRIIGVPGDIIELNDNVLTINGEQLSYQLVSPQASKQENSQDLKEDLLGVEHFIRVEKTGSAMSSFDPVVIPSDQYLALGDNRDNSADSRVIGFVPRHEIVGRSKSVVLSFDYENYYIPRKDRFFQSL